MSAVILNPHATFGDRIDWDNEARRAAAQELPGASPDAMLDNIASALGAPVKSGKVPTPWRIVDCGCNIGRFFPQFDAAGFDYTGIDQSPEAIATARERYGKRGATFHQSLLWEDWPESFPPFDAALCNAVLQHNVHAEKPGILRRIAQAVRIGGVFGMQESTMPPGHATGTQWTQSEWIEGVTAHGFELLKTWHPNPEYGIDDAYLFRRVGPSSALHESNRSQSLVR